MKKKEIFSTGISASAEFDYFSLGGNVGFTKFSKDKNREFTAKAMAFLILGK